jgi:hypothetical protein
MGNDQGFLGRKIPETVENIQYRQPRHKVSFSRPQILKNSRDNGVRVLEITPDGKSVFVNNFYNGLQQLDIPRQKFIKDWYYTHRGGCTVIASTQDSLF